MNLYPCRIAGIAAFLLALATGCGKQPVRGPVANDDDVKKLRIAFGGAEAATTGTAVAGATGSAWGKISGVFKIVGDPPNAKTISITASPEVCMPGNKPVLSRTLIVDSATKGVANIVVFARKTVRVHDQAKAVPSDPVVFDQKNCLFTSPMLAYVKGQKVVMKNSDPLGHNINFKINVLIPGGGQLDYVDTSEDSLPVKVKCDVHPWMGAYLLSRNNGYFAVTKDNGSFEIANVPDGEEIEFMVWHERVKKSWDIQPAGVTWDKKGRFKVKLAENEDKKVEFAIPAALFDEE